MPECHEKNIQGRVVLARVFAGGVRRGRGVRGNLVAGGLIQLRSGRVLLRSGRVHGTVAGAIGCLRVIRALCCLFVIRFSPNLSYQKTLALSHKYQRWISYCGSLESKKGGGGGGGVLRVVNTYVMYSSSTSYRRCINS